jgi:adenosine 3'-phospho 5'-phosphosulfate transporter B3
MLLLLLLLLMLLLLLQCYCRQYLQSFFYLSVRSLLVSYILCRVITILPSFIVMAVQVTYPVKIVFKSSKLIPTMIVSIFFFKKTYSVSDYCSALLLCVGTALFVYDPTAPSSSTTSLLSPGVGLLVAAVMCDAFLPNVQKQMMNSVSPEELMVNSNLLGFLLVALYMLYSGSMLDLLHVLTTAEDSLRLCLALAGIGFSLASAVFCYTHLIQEAGPIVAVGVATIRKVVTLVLSYVVFPKPLSWVEVGALCLIGGGVGVEAWKRTLTPPTK